MKVVLLVLLLRSIITACPYDEKCRSCEFETAEFGTCNKCYKSYFSRTTQECETNFGKKEPYCLEYKQMISDPSFIFCSECELGAFLDKGECFKCPKDCAKCHQSGGMRPCSYCFNHMEVDLDGICIPSNICKQNHCEIC